MDYDSSNKFISSLAKFLQSLCNGYVEFDNGVQVIGHLYLSVDTGKTMDYVLNEKVCKTDENSVTFISNSFHAQPAEKPKPPGKRGTKDGKGEEGGTEEEQQEVSNGSSARNVGQNSSLSGLKRPHSPSQRQSPHSKSGRSSPKYRKSGSESFEQSASHPSSQPNEGSISSAPSPAGEGGPSGSVQGVGYNEGYSESYFADEDTVDESERDVKPTLDTDVTFIKEEFGPGSGNQGREGSQGDDQTVFPSNQAYSSMQYSSQFGSSFGGQRSAINPAGDRSSSMYSTGGSSQMESGDASGDPSGLPSVELSAGSTSRSPSAQGKSSWGPFRCDDCKKCFRAKREFDGHMYSHHLNIKPYACSHCSKSFVYKKGLIFHLRTIHGMCINSKEFDRKLQPSQNPHPGNHQD